MKIAYLGITGQHFWANLCWKMVEMVTAEVFTVVVLISNHMVYIQSGFELSAQGLN